MTKEMRQDVRKPLNAPEQILHKQDIKSQQGYGVIKQKSLIA